MNQDKGISIVITNLNDFRTFGLIDVLRKFQFSEIIIADGGSNKAFLEKVNTINSPKIKFYDLPGSIAVTRSKVVSKINGEITVFIDTDEIPCKDDWLEELVFPIVTGEADFTFGPTSPLKPPANRIARYFDSYDKWFYSNVLPFDISKGPMGNSAWRTDLLREIGFDPGLSIGGEDYDVNLRALAAGYHGKFSKNAVVYHDQNGIKTLRSFIKKMFWNYLTGASLAYRKNNSGRKKISSSFSGSLWKGDPLEILVIILKPFALITSYILSMNLLRKWKR